MINNFFFYQGLLGSKYQKKDLAKTAYFTPSAGQIILAKMSAAKMSFIRLLHFSF